MSALAELQELMAESERILGKAQVKIVMHPDDVNDAVLDEIGKYPLVTLHESSFVEQGQAIVIRPGEIGL